jgi:glycine oxidase
MPRVKGAIAVNCHIGDPCTPMSADNVVIIGGGVIGLMCAFLLKQEKIAALLLESEEVGRESSWAGAGILAPLYPLRYPQNIGDLARQSADLYRPITKQLFDLTGIDPEYHESGAIILDPDDKDQESEDNLRDKWRRPFQFFDKSELHQLEPSIKSAGPTALLLPDVAQVRNPRLLKALRAAVGTGGGIREQARVTGFEISEGRLVGIRAGEESIPASRCIVAAGAWSTQLLEAAGLSIAVRPVRGQILLVGAPPRALQRIVINEYRYLVPRRDGKILVGSTMEEVGFDKSTTKQARLDLLGAAIAMMPSLADYPIEAQWAGLRPGVPDNLPFIGEHPEVKGLFVCTGHYRNGLALAPASAQLVVDLLLGRPPRLDPKPFSLDRPLGLKSAN